MHFPDGFASVSYGTGVEHLLRFVFERPGREPVETTCRVYEGKTVSAPIHCLVYEGQTVSALVWQRGSRLTQCPAL